MDGIIFDIAHGSFVDGPGIRTTVFFKGCNLRCAWCHNPESQSFETQLLFYKNKCTGCGKCVEVCPHSLKECTLCGKCELYCHADARKICGMRCTTEEIMKDVEKDISFYEASGGGVTFSGGECMLQMDFLLDLLKASKEKGIHTAVDTAGNVSWERFERILPYTDLFLFDMKCFSEDIHIRYVGASNKLILENLQHLTGKKEILVRIPVIPSVNANREELEKMAIFLKTAGIKQVELLPYHRMGEHKYEALGLSYQKFEIPTEEEMAEYRKLFD